MNPSLYQHAETGNQIVHEFQEYSLDSRKYEDYVINLRLSYTEQSFRDTKVFHSKESARLGG